MPINPLVGILLLPVPSLARTRSDHIGKLGKEFAGRTVVIDSLEPGVWVIKTAQTIPDSELWLHQPPRSADLEALEQHLGML